MSFSKLHIDIDHHCTESEQGPWLIRAEGFVLYGMQAETQSAKGDGLWFLGSSHFS